MADEARVTQAGRQAATQIAADVRVTQAGRQAVTQLDGDVRVTQAGRQAVTQIDGTLRISQLGRNVLQLELRPNAPLIFSPNAVATYQGSMSIVHALSEDPLGGTTTHTFRYRKVGDTIWIVAFTGRAGNDAFPEDISALADGSYEAEAYANNTGGTGKQSATATVVFTIDNNTPSTPFFITPFDGQELVQQTAFPVTWLAATDPNDDALTYTLEYRAIGAGSWTPITTGVTALFYNWNMSALGADDYEIQIWATDGTNPGAPDNATFSVTLADQPLAPVIRIAGIDPDCVTIEVFEYAHPTPRAWASTTYQIIPVDGDWSNTVVNYTTTDPDEQLTAKFCGLGSGFEGYVRVFFTDNAANDSNFSEQAQFQIGAQSRFYIQKWDLDAIWSASIQGEIEGIALEDGTQQEAAAVVDEDSISHGSVFVNGEVMEGGRNYGLGGLDTELRDMGVGIFEGYRVDDSQRGIAMYLDVGTHFSDATFPGKLSANLRLEGFFPRASDTDPQIRRSISVDVGYILIELVAGLTNVGYTPVSPWTSSVDRKPWYKIEMLINRNVSAASPTTRIRGRVTAMGGVNVSLAGMQLLEGVGEGGWHLDVTYPLLGPCGQPGYMFGQGGLGHGPLAKTYFRRLTFGALRDDGLPVPTTIAQPGEVAPAGPVVCTPQSEAALTAPVFFPVPPNGDVTEREILPTDVIRSWDDTEQRIALRARATVAVGWLCTLPTAREMGDFAALIYGDQPGRWGVPLWQDAAPLTVDLASSSGSIPAASVDTTDRRFERMTHVALWVDQFTWDFSAAVLENDGSITLTTPTTQPFTGGAKGPTFVLPCRVGRMNQQLTMSRHSPNITELDIEFILEGVND